MAEEYGEVSVQAKKKILGLNAARLYDIKVPAEADLPAEPATAETS
jgi:hypothetical protein